MSLAIVIVSYESADTLGRCLAGIAPARLASTIVVDNASTDVSVDIARAFGARVLRMNENLGFARAATRGAAEAAERHLCFLNPDCEPGPELFEAGLAALDGHPRRCAVPDLVQQQASVLPGRQPGYTRTKLLADMIENHYGRRSAGWLRRLPFHDDPSWAWPHGACLFIGRSFFEQLGGFDGAYFLYMEDVDLGRRIAAAGGEVVALEQRLRHAAASGARVGRRQRRALLDAGRLTYARRVYGGTFAALLRGCTLPSRWLRRGGARPR